MMVAVLFTEMSHSDPGVQGEEKGHEKKTPQRTHEDRRGKFEGEFGRFWDAIQEGHSCIYARISPPATASPPQDGGGRAHLGGVLGLWGRVAKERGAAAAHDVRARRGRPRTMHAAIRCALRGGGRRPVVLSFSTGDLRTNKTA